MKPARSYFLVLVTAPNVKVARMLARDALNQRLVACANLVPALESHYWWNGEIESAKEVMILMKTAQPRLEALEKFVIAAHPYDTPEFLVLPLSAGTDRYLDWITASVSKPPASKARAKRA